MGSPGRCVVCTDVVDNDVVKEEFEDLLDQVDAFGPDSLTDNEQAVYYGYICSQECFDTLE